MSPPSLTSGTKRLMLMRRICTNQMVVCVRMSMQKTTYAKASMDPMTMPSINIIYNMSII